MRQEWQAARPYVGGILGLSSEAMQKVMVQMVSRWCSMFIKQRMQESDGVLSQDDVSTLLDWVPMFFGIDKDVAKKMVQQTNKGILQGKAVRLVNKPSTTLEDVKALRAELDTWDLQLESDLELTKAQLRALFRLEVIAALESRNFDENQKRAAVATSRANFGLFEAEANEELEEILRERCKGCLVNAVGDLMQGNELSVVEEMQRLQLLAAFASSEGINIDQVWDVAAPMRSRALQNYIMSATANDSTLVPDVDLLKRTLGLSA